MQLKDQAVRGYSSNRDGIEKRGPSKQGLAVEQESEGRLGSQQDEFGRKTELAISAKMVLK